MGFASFGLLMTNVLVSSVGKGGFKLVGLDSGCNGLNTKRGNVLDTWG